MPTSTWLCRTALLGTLASCLCTVSIVRADDDEPEKSAQVERLEIHKLRPTVRAELIDDIGALSKFWLNMRLTSVPKVLDEQLELHGEGAVVSQVGADGPAAKAGLKVNDVIVAVGDTPIKKISDVAEAVDKSEGKEVTLKVVRAGKPTTVAITPIERYGSGKGYPAKSYKFAGKNEIEVEIQKLEEKIREKLEDAGVDVRMHLIQPGKMVPYGLALQGKAVEFPDDVSVEIRKQGKNPAEITVKQGDKSWNVKEDKLSELPENLRPYVESLRGHGAMRFAIGIPPGLPADTKFTIPVPPPGPKSQALRGQSPGIREHLRDSVERRLDEMSREMSRMRERMEELRRSLREERKPGKGDGGDDKDDA